jgi:hypothetical protein
MPIFLNDAAITTNLLGVHVGDQQIPLRGGHRREYDRLPPAPNARAMITPTESLYCFSNFSCTGFSARMLACCIVRGCKRDVEIGQEIADGTKMPPPTGRDMYGHNADGSRGRPELEACLMPGNVPVSPKH